MEMGRGPEIEGKGKEKRVVDMQCKKKSGRMVECQGFSIKSIALTGVSNTHCYGIIIFSMRVYEPATSGIMSKYNCYNLLVGESHFTLFMFEISRVFALFMSEISKSACVVPE